MDYIAENTVHSINKLFIGSMFSFYELKKNHHLVLTFKYSSVFSVPTLPWSDHSTLGRKTSFSLMLLTNSCTDLTAAYLSALEHV